MNISCARCDCKDHVKDIQGEQVITRQVTPQPAIPEGNKFVDPPVRNVTVDTLEVRMLRPTDRDPVWLDKNELLRVQNTLLTKERQRLEQETEELKKELEKAQAEYMTFAFKDEPKAGVSSQESAKVHKPTMGHDQPSIKERAISKGSARSSMTMNSSMSGDSIMGGRKTFAGGRKSKHDMRKETTMGTTMGVTENADLVEHSIAGLPASLRVLIWLIAGGFVVFTLLAPAYGIGKKEDDSSGSAGEGSPASDEGRRLGGGGGGPSVITNIAYCMTGAGLIAFVMHLLKQPLLLGYLMGGVLVGPTGLQLVNTAEEIDTITELGLILLLFMIGLELDCHELITMFKTEKAVLVTGIISLPISAAVQGGIFALFAIDEPFWGEGKFAIPYFSVCTAISSTMIVVRLLAEKMETDTAAGRLTVGVLMCQDLWAMVFLSGVQPNLSNPEAVEILKTFGFIAVLIIVSLLLAKFVLPAVLASVAESLEMMLVLSLGWCFFICALAMLPFVNLNLETAAFIAGVSMATFPYSSEFNSKLKYIRDFFVTLYFCGLGMQIPPPSGDPISKAVLACFVISIGRWIGVFGVIFACGKGQRISVLPTINLSQVSEFSLVICSLGRNYGHVKQDTFEILIWTFTILAVSAQYAINLNHEIYKLVMPWLNTLHLVHSTESQRNLKLHLEDDEEERDIIILGFFRTASALIAEFEEHCPLILKKIHVMDVCMELEPAFKRKGIAFSYADISDARQVEEAHVGRCSLVVCTVPDQMLRGCTNESLLMNAKMIWPEAHVVVSADTSKQAKALYKAGAAYVLNRVRLSAEKLATLIHEHETVAGGGGQIRDLMRAHQEHDESKTYRRFSLIME